MPGFILSYFTNIDSFKSHNTPTKYVKSNLGHLAMFPTITPCCFLADSSKNVISMELNARKMCLHSLLGCLSLLPILPSSLPRLKKKINKISSVILFHYAFPSLKQQCLLLVMVF